MEPNKSLLGGYGCVLVPHLRITVTHQSRRQYNIWGVFSTHTIAGGFLSMDTSEDKEPASVKEILSYQVSNDLEEDAFFAVQLF